MLAGESIGLAIIGTRVVGQVNVSMIEAEFTIHSSRMLRGLMTRPDLVVCKMSL